MKRLQRAILKDYDIELNRPQTLRMLQFGLEPLQTGLIDRLIDDANRQGADFGLAVTCADAPEKLRLLKEQEGLCTVFVRGDKGEERVQIEQVLQCILEVLSPEEDDDALLALAGRESLSTLLLLQDPTGEHRAGDLLHEAMAARFLIECWRRGRGPMHIVVCAEDLSAPEAVRARMLKTAEDWRAPARAIEYLKGCAFHLCLADCLTQRGDAEEAARLCETMNYADGMIHLAEPYGLVAVEASAGGALPTGFLPRLCCAEDLEKRLLLKQRVFDAGLFTLCAAGLLRGNATLAECMKDEPLRDLAGRALMDEILPALPLPRQETAPYIIQCYERYENAMNDNRLENCGRGLVHKWLKGALPVYLHREQAGEPLPEKLTVALSCAILLLADARKTGDGWETVAGEARVPVHEAPEVLEAFSRLSSDMDPESLVYAVLSDRELWAGRDLRQLEGLTEALIADLDG